MGHEYVIRVSLKTDRVLNAQELANLEGAIELQCCEPQDFDGNDETWNCAGVSISVEGIVRSISVGGE